MKTVLEQALEALEAMIDYIPDNTVQGDWDAGLAFNAIAALKEAIKQQGEPVATVMRNKAGQIFMARPDGNAFDMYKYIGQSLYTSAPTIPEGWREFIEAVSKQKPEKPDYWSTCMQCERNISDAEDLLSATTKGQP
jgi:hypothetical protein